MPCRHARRGCLASRRWHLATCSAVVGKRSNDNDGWRKRLMTNLTRRWVLAAAGLLAAPIVPARAETKAVRLSHGYSTGYLPMMVMRDQKLIEKHAQKAGLGT